MRLLAEPNKLRSSEFVRVLGPDADDPAFGLRIRQLKLWATAVWEHQALHCSLQEAMLAAIEAHPPGQPFVWGQVGGAAAALLGSARRLGWDFIDFADVSDHTGNRFPLRVLSPVFVAEREPANTIGPPPKVGSLKLVFAPTLP